MSRPRALDGLPRGVWWGLALALLLGSYLAHLSTLGLHFPTPWPDEGSFLWPAIAVQEHSTLLAPQLNPERPVMWMPPGYMILQGLIFKLTGFSFSWARTLSALYLCGALVCLAGLLGRLRLRWAHLALVAVFLHSPGVLLAGNTARMEPLVLLLGLGGCLLVQRRMIYLGLCVVALAPLVHPNGVFFGLAGLLLAAPIVWREPRRLRPARLELVALALVLACWGAYGLHVAQHWDSFLADMRMQVDSKLRIDQWTGGAGRRALDPVRLIPDLLLLGAALYARRYRLALWPLIAVAAALQALGLLMVGWMYELYAATGLLLASVVTLEVLGHASSRLPWMRPAPRAVAAVIVLTLALGGANQQLLARDLAFTGAVAKAASDVDVHSGPAYFTPTDRRAIAAYLRTLEASPRPLTVQFLPWSDALLVPELQTARVRFLQPTMYERPSDVCIIHRSRRIPKTLVDSIGLRVTFREKVPVEPKNWPSIQERDGTERWIVYRRR